jgi:hypothetical protein
MKSKFFLLLVIAIGIAIISKQPRVEANNPLTASFQLARRGCTSVQESGLTPCACAVGGQTGDNLVGYAVWSGCGRQTITLTDVPCRKEGSDLDECEPDDIGTNLQVRSCTVEDCNRIDDTDGDGYGDSCCGGGDCNDTNRNINPGANPHCNTVFPAGFDNNCNGIDDFYECGAGESCGGCWSDDFCAAACSPHTDCAGSLCDFPTPIVIDVQGNGFDLTDAPGGVTFDLSGDGTTERVSWTAGWSDDAWLALDRNGNGRIDNGPEMFGSMTPQPQFPQGQRNGFLALAEYDKAASGGNGDGQIDSRDSIFSALRLWQDANHNGATENGELHTLAEFGIAVLELDYKVSKRTDEHGNQFKWRAKVKDVHGAQVGRWAWDVILKRQ